MNLSLKKLLTALGPLLALAILFIGFRCAAGEGFWSEINLRLLLAQTAIVAVGACGATLIIVAGGIDLSIGSVLALSAVGGALALRGGADPLLAAMAAIGAGALCGCTNGLVIALGRLPPFVVTLGMLGIARGAAKGLADNSAVNYPSGGWIDRLMQPLPLPHDPAWVHALVVAPGVWIAASLTLATWFLMSHTVFGRQVYAIGSNPVAARLCGVPVRRTTVLIYLLGGAAVGLAGLLELAKLHQGDPTTAGGRELDVIAAVVIGGASLSGGTGTVIGSLIGALIMGVLRNGSQQLGWPTWAQEIIIGIVIVVAVGIDRLRNRTRS